METQFFIFDTDEELEPFAALDYLRNGGILETDRGEILTINEADVLESTLDWLTSGV